MRLTIVTAGSRGDVQPYVALALGLQRQGHQVTVATHEHFRDFVTGWGVGFAPVAGDPQALLHGEIGQRWLATGRNVLEFLREVRRFAGTILEPALADVVAATRDADAVVGSVLGLPVWHIAERRGIPMFAAPLQPVTPTREFAAIGLPARPRLGPWLNQVSHHVAEQMLWQPLRGHVNRWRRDALGLPKERFLGPSRRMQEAGVPVLYGFSRHVVPPPGDWGANVHVTGWWFLDRPAGYVPPPALARFLADGPPPVYVGFGSMTPRDASVLTRLALDALERAGARGVLLRGWGGLGAGELPPWAISVGDVPHEWLLPRMAAVVHHGGAGTTGASLRAGVPSIVTPLFVDQPFWGRRVHELGVGPAPIMRRDLTADSLARAIGTSLADEAMRERASRLGESIRAEDGVRHAVEIIDAKLDRAVRAA